MKIKTTNKPFSSKTADGRTLPDNQTELISAYRAEYERIKPTTMKQILALREKYELMGMVV
jgi:hypothetical protein